MVLGGLPQDIGGVADEIRVKAALEIGGKCVHAPAALLCDGHQDRCRHLGCRRALAPRVAEDVETRKGELLDQVDGMFELLVGLPREADDDV